MQSYSRLKSMYPSDFPARWVFRHPWKDVNFFTVYHNPLVCIVPTSTIASTTLAEISRLDLLDLNTPPLASITNVKHLTLL